jgi:hypothetical protein
LVGIQKARIENGDRYILASPPLGMERIQPYEPQ